MPARLLYATRLPIIVLVAIALHGVWAVGLLIDPSAHYATAVHALMLLTKHTMVAALILLVVASSASLGIGWRRNVWVFPAHTVRAILILPQQCLLIMSSIGALSAMLASSFVDGVIRPLWFIVVDQVPVILITIGHFTALAHIARSKDE